MNRTQALPDHLISASNGDIHERADAGFSLIEVLVALAILGLSFGTLFSVFSLCLHTARETSLLMEARVLARSLIQQPQTRIGDNEGTATDGLNWRIRTVAYNTSGSDPNVDMGLLRVDATVWWEDLGRERTVSLETLQITPAEKQQ